MAVNVNWAWAAVTAAKTINASGRSRFIGSSIGACARAPRILGSESQPVNVQVLHASIDYHFCFTTKITGKQK